MTCIVALEHNGKVYMGGDSASVSDWDIEQTVNKKVFKLGDILFGYTSSFRMGQLLQYNLNIPDNDCDDDMRYLVTKLIPEVRTCFRDNGYLKVENNREVSGTFLLGYHGRAYRVASDFQVNRMLAGFIATGCGESYALGALAAMDIINPELSVLRALEVAGTFSNGVCAPYYVLSN